MSWFEASARWYLILVLMTWGLAPLVRLLCARLADRGATVARPLALLAVVYPLWLAASLDLLPYSTTGLWLILVIGSTAGWGLALYRREVSRDWLRSLLIVEGLSVAAFAAYVWLRGYTPEIVNTEKPMDSAFLAASARSESIPPIDPWFSGEPINYYYFGYLLHGALARLAAVPASLGYNLALATTFSMTLTAAVGLGCNVALPWLTRRWALVVGASVAVLVCIVGNLYAAVKLIERPSATFHAAWWADDNNIGWNSSRVVWDWDVPASVKETINEFPFFSFLLGDLHPHVMALPFTVVALALAFNLVLIARGPVREFLPRADWGVIGLTGVAIGSLYAMNSWDYPTFLVVALAGLWFGLRKVLPERMRWQPMLFLAATSFLAWLPFFLTFVPLTSGDKADLPNALRDVPILTRLLLTLGVVTWERTSVGEFLTVFGVPYVAALWFLGRELLRVLPAEPSRSATRAAIVVITVAFAVAIALPAPLVILCGAPLAGAIILLRRDSTLSLRTIATALFAAGFALILATEFFYIQDVFGNRMNTVFKVYYQVWTLFALATALAAILLWREAAPRGWMRPAVTVAAGLAVAAGMVYPLLASYRWTAEFDDWQGLDGIAYLGDSRPDELAAIRWLRDNAQEDDVILEAAGCGYDSRSRVSAFTGVPTVIGWGNSEGQWRVGQPELLAEMGQRQQDVATMYANPSSELFDYYGITLLFVGQLERMAPERPGCDLAGPYEGIDSPSYPGAGWQEVFASGEVRIYRRQA